MLLYKNKHKYVAKFNINQIITNKNKIAAHLLAYHNNSSLIYLLFLLNAIKVLNKW